MDIKQMAIEAGVIYITEEGLYWTENDAIQALDRFAKVVIEKVQQEKTKMKFNTYGWMGQFESDYKKLGVGFASRVAKRKKVPMSMVLATVRQLEGSE